MDMEGVGGSGEYIASSASIFAAIRRENCGAYGDSLSFGSGVHVKSVFEGGFVAWVRMSILSHHILFIW